MQYKIAIVGEKDAVYAFGMLGMNVFYTTDATQGRQVVKEIIDNDYGVIFITEKLAQQIPDIIKKYDDEFMPAFILIPSDHDSESIGLQRVQENVKKAVGQNIL